MRQQEHETDRNGLLEARTKKAQNRRLWISRAYWKCGLGSALS